MIKYSLIVPCYNEGENVPLLIDRAKVVFSDCKDIELILVDNGSSDNTFQIIEAASKSFPFIKAVKVELNQGYGFGILSGLKIASGELIGWTHADMQTDLGDVLKSISLYENRNELTDYFIKGRRVKRPIFDNFFTIGMSFFETILLRQPMWDINAQPTLFSRDLFDQWSDAPHDFSLDLFAYYSAKKMKYKIMRHPVHFGLRAHGKSHWNINIASKFNFIKRTLAYSLRLKKGLK